MNPIQLSNNLKTTLRSYLTTIFDVNRDGKEPELANAIEQSFNIDGALSNGPYLEITPPYVAGLSLRELVNEGVLTQDMINLPEDNLPLGLDIPLYTHQEQAIRKLVSDNRNIVVSSGTGSGKTESFLIPILNDLLIDSSSGVRALLVYPLNALVNDQLDRLRTLLKDTDITFGRYTSELDNQLKYAQQNYPNALPNEVISREEIQSGEKIPQILITNYAMLEYLLLRPQDSKLFNRGKWKFVVLDEAHTYSGAQGIEVSMLLRRLKHRLGKQHGEIQCIATSATLTDDDTNDAIQFAENLFNETFAEGDIIFGSRDKAYAPTDETHHIDETVYLDDRFEEIIENIRNEISTDDIALLMKEIGLIPDSLDWDAIADSTQDNPHRFVWNILKDNAHLIQLREYLSERDEPIDITNVAENIFSGSINTIEEQKLALYRLIELGAIARPKPEASSLLPARYHMFMRSPQGVWACFNPDCNGRETDKDAGWSRVFSDRRETCSDCGCKVFPISVCRECGQVYIKTKYKDGQYVSEPHYHQNDLIPDYETRYFVWRDLLEDRALGAEPISDIEEEKDTSQASKSGYDTSDTKICLVCGQQVRAGACNCEELSEQRHITLKMIMKIEAKKDKIQKHPYDFMNECPRCRSSAQKETEIATSISVNGTSPLSTITYELYRELPESTKDQQQKKPGNGRKLLTFYDSRQGAARFASYLQDTVNTENYRHIIPTAINKVLADSKIPPDIDRLAKEAFDIAWGFKIFHNEVDSGLRYSEKPRRNQQSKYVTKVKTQILGEVTTGRLRRQSLESLGLIAVHYFDDNDPDFMPDFANLADKLGLSIRQTRTLIEYFLDDLRKRKVIEMPNGVEASDHNFGHYEGHPTLIRSNAKVYAHQQPWIGKTARHSRRRYMKKVLEFANQSATEDDIINALSSIFNWLIDERNDLMVGSGADGFRLKCNTLLFSTDSQWYRCNKCQRLNAHGDELPCPHPHCDGTLDKIDIEQAQAKNFFYQSFIKKVVPIRVEEHTAQLASEKGRDYQNKFRSGDINMLSCSTTFEMGIDLGDLQAVVMSNVPPTVANYRQRAGRAGRRIGGAAFILTWASDRPHDQTYFRKPTDIIRGYVRVPYIAIDNPFIQNRHINAILLSEFLRYRRDQRASDWKTLGAFFNPQHASDPHLKHLAPWLETHRSQIEMTLAEFSKFVEHSNIDFWIDNFKNDIVRVYEEYNRLSTYYMQKKQELSQEMLKKIAGDSSKYTAQITQFNNYLNRLQKERLIDYFSARGVLPSYSFPLNSVELQLPQGDKGKQVRLQRDLKLAIREYAPGAEVVADKRIWRSDGVQFFQDTVRSEEYRICETCNGLDISEGPGMSIAKECSVCGASASKLRPKTRQYIIPDGFFARVKDNGKPARQYVKSEYVIMRSALIPKQMMDEAKISPLVSYAYDHEGTLLYVNEGNVRDNGFYINLDGEYRGSVITDKKEKKNTKPVSLGHRRSTDTLRLRFHNTPDVHMPSSDNMSFWLSLMYALIQGASRALQIERSDIDGVLFPIKNEEAIVWEQTIILYDDVPGGAGHVRQIQKEFANVVAEALKIVNCTDCSPETSCYHCLRDYNNQLYHHILKRDEVTRFLQSLLASLVKHESDIKGVVSVSAINQPFWLMQQVENAKSSVQISMQSITLDKPVGALRNWLEVFQDLLRRNIKVTLSLQDFSVDIANPETLSIGIYLMLLKKDGLNLQSIDRLPAWQVLIDVEKPNLSRAIHIDNSCILNAKIGENGGILTTIHKEGVAVAENSHHQARTKNIDSSYLQAPPTTQVINYAPIYNKKQTERDLFADVFSSAITEMVVNDRYLYDYEGIVERLGAYIKLAHEQGKLQKVTVYTFPADKNHNTGSKNIQNRAIKKLQDAYPDVSIEFKRKNPKHDRFIILTRVDGSKARILIGHGLGFIQSNGRNHSTYIIIENDYVSK